MTLEAAVVDSSALMSILLDEPAGGLFLEEIAGVRDLFISAATEAEVLLAAFASAGPKARWPCPS